MATTTKYSIDLWRTPIMRLDLQQYEDAGRVIEWQIKDDAIAKDITGYAIALRLIKPDGNLVEITASIKNAINGVCTTIITNQAVAAAGRMREANLCLTKTGEAIYTRSIPIYVLTSAELETAVTSTSEWQSLTDVVAAMNGMQTDLSEVVRQSEAARDQSCLCATNSDESRIASEAARDRAEAAAGSIGTAVQDAQSARDAAAGSATEAAQSASAAEASKTAAAGSATTAIQKATAAATSATQAATSAQSAATAKSGAESAKEDAEAARDAAQASQTVAKSSEDAALASKNVAAQSASTASTKAGEAAASATAAASSAQAAATSETKAAASESSVNQTLAEMQSQLTAMQDATQAARNAAEAIIPTASKSKAGIVKIGDGLSITEDGTLSADAPDLTAELAGKADKTHTHVIADVTGLQEVLDGKADDADVTALSQTVTDGLAGKVDKVSGSRLMLDTEGTKLAGIATGANNYTLPTANSSTKGGVKLSDSTSSTSGVSGGVAATPAAVKAAYDLANGKANATHSHAVEDVEGLQAALDAKVTAVSGKGLSTNDYDAEAKAKVDAIPDSPKYTDTTYITATTSTAGLMSADDKAKLDAIEAGATATTITNDLTATAAGTALDAAQGKILKDMFGEVTQFRTMTKADYDALATKDPTTIYFVTE